MKSNLVTIILPLLDRSNYTKSWIKENLYDEITYVIADASIDDANQLIFDELKENHNVKYIRYPHDATIDDFIKKITNTIKIVETPYVMLVDNDDFLNKPGIAACVEVLESDKSIGFAHGKINHVTGTTAGDDTRLRYKLQRPACDPIMLHNKSGMPAIQSLFQPYSYLWYGVYRTTVCKNIWEHIGLSKINNIFLIEMLQSQLACHFAKMQSVRLSHYIRLANSASSIAVQFSSKQYPVHHGIYFDDNYRDQVLQMAQFISNLLGVDTRALHDEYRRYYSTIDHPRRIRSLVWDEVMTRCYRYLMPACSINTIRRVLSYPAWA
jgi:glycosyltransferase domain-containing protein